MEPQLVADDKTKIRIAKYGPRVLFNGTRDGQPNSDQDLIDAFNKVWDDRLCRAIADADPIQTKKAGLERLLTPREQEFFRENEEHRRFFLKKEGLVFIAQLIYEEGTNTLKLTQLWNIPAKRRLEADDIYSVLKRKREESKVWSESYYSSSLGYRWAYLSIGVPATILAMVASSQYVTGILQEKTAAISLVVGGLTALQTFLDFGKEREKREAAGKAWGKLVREIDQHLLRIEMDDVALKDQFKILRDVSQKMNDLEDFSPALGQRRYKKAIQQLGPETDQRPKWIGRVSAWTRRLMRKSP